MLIVTAKLPRRKLAFGAAAAALLCCAALVLNLVPAGYRAAAAPANIPSSRGIRTNTDRVAYLNGCGWQVMEEPHPGGDGRELPPLSGAPGRPGL